MSAPQRRHPGGLPSHSGQLDPSASLRCHHDLDWKQQLRIPNHRVVFFIDYQANQTEVPYILDEFSQMWETPFSPTNASFPCTVQRPPKLSSRDARNRLYIANHNLNFDIQLAGQDLLVPNTVDINQTNEVSGPGSLGNMSAECTSRWTIATLKK